MNRIIDRRLNGKNKSLPNRERFVRRYKEQIKRAVAENMNSKSMQDIARDGNMKVPIKDTSEPSIVYGQGGNRKYVVPGNKEFVPGDSIPKPKGGGQGQGKGSKPSESGESEDEFSFVLSRDEFMEMYFEGMELPDLVRKDLASQVEKKFIKAGFTHDGVPTALSVVRTMKASLARQIALGVKSVEETELEELIDRLMRQNPADPSLPKLRERLAELVALRETVPFLDDIDLRYRNTVVRENPTTNAVMLCIMDVSGSMDEHRKDLAKRFFTLLYLFLNQKYEQVELVFIRHTDVAEEVDEQTFFYDRKSGGTKVLSALELAYDVIKARYPAAKYNVYIAQASDGDAFPRDADECQKMMTQKILPLVQYVAYIEALDPQSAEMWSSLMNSYNAISKSSPKMGVKRVTDKKDIYPVFKSLFTKKGA